MQKLLIKLAFEIQSDIVCKYNHIVYVYYHHIPVLFSKQFITPFNFIIPVKFKIPYNILYYLILNLFTFLLITYTLIITIYDYNIV